MLAIAGLIMLIVFLAIPALQRNARNYDRKNYVGLIDGVLNEYYDNHGSYPGAVGAPGSDASQASICDFLKSLPRVDPKTATCKHYGGSAKGLNGPQSANCVSIQAGPYLVCYQDWENVSHGYIGPPDEISIMLAHWCNTGANVDSSEPSTYPVAGDDSNTHRYAVWTQLEGVRMPLCLDNMPSSDLNHS